LSHFRFAVPGLFSYGGASDENEVATIRVDAKTCLPELVTGAAASKS
jgi:hypothetical protein